MSKCKCGKELLDGEKKCERCKAKRKEKGKNIIKGVLCVAGLGLYVGKHLIDKKK